MAFRKTVFKGAFTKPSPEAFIAALMEAALVEAVLWESEHHDRGQLLPAGATKTAKEGVGAGTTTKTPGWESETDLLQRPTAART